MDGLFIEFNIQSSSSGPGHAGKFLLEKKKNAGIVLNNIYLAR